MLLPLVPPHTVITCIHSWYFPYCSPLWTCPCAWVPWSCNCHPCLCFAYASRNIFRNMRAFDCPWQGPVERVGGLLVFFLPLSPYLVERSCISSWLWARSYCKSCYVTGIGWSVNLCWAMFTMFDWCWNSAKKAAHDIFYDMCMPVYRVFKGQLNYTVSAGSRWNYQKWGLDGITKFPFLLRML